MQEINWELLNELENQQCGDPVFRHLSPNYVSGYGADNPEAFVIGEAPGAQEDIAGKPFVGPAGIMLRRLMALAGLNVDTTIGFTKGMVPYEKLPPNIWLTNTVKFRPPRNRRPTHQEVEAARPYLISEWLAVGAPKLIIAVGNVPLSALFKKKMAITMVSGKCMQRESRKGICYVWPMIHPSYGLMNPGIQPVLEQDWIKLGEWRAKNQL